MQNREVVMMLLEEKKVLNSPFFALMWFTARVSSQIVLLGTILTNSTHLQL